MPDHATAVAVLQDPFDYAAEDELIEAYSRGDWEAMKAVKWAREPGFSIMGKPIQPKSAHDREIKRDFNH